MSETFNFGYGDVPAHRHENGGGWVANSALVYPTAYVGSEARVSGEALVYGEALRIATETSVPSINKLDAAILAAINDNGNRLDMSDWHSCATTHCRAGFAIHLCGKDGYALEREVGPWLAGALIYKKSTGRIPDFFANTADAMRDIEASAGEGEP